MDDLVRRREVETLNDLSRLYPLGTLSGPLKDLRLASPEAEAPDAWRWLPPGQFPPDWEWLDILAQLNAVRLTYKVSNVVVVRVYVVPEDVRKLGVLYNKKGKEAFRRLVLDIDTSVDAWKHGRVSQSKQPLLEDKRSTTLAQIYNTLESPSDKPSLDEVSQYERHAFDAVRNNAVPALISQLYPYQARTVQRMLLQELHPPKVLDPKLLEIEGATGVKLYLSLEEFKFWKYPTLYEAPRGGILGEEMGSGKTCESLALILVSWAQIPVNPAVEPGTDLRLPIKHDPRFGVRPLQHLAAQAAQQAATPYRWYQYEMSPNCIELLEQYRPYYIIPPPTLRTRLRRNRTDEDGNELVEVDTRPGTEQWLSHATLVVVPDTLVSQWRHEISKHVQGDILKVLVISASGRKVKEDFPPLEELLKFDVVLISHSRFSKEEEQIAAVSRCICSYEGRTRDIICNCPPPISYVSPLTSIHWKRLIVDEGHTMSSAHTKAVRFAASLNLERRWVVSGTPSRGLVGASADGQEGTQNERFDLERLSVTMIEFLGLQALDKQSWRRYITKPFLDRALGSEQVVRMLLNSMIVRNRTSDIQRDVVLPPLTKNVIYLDATQETVLSQNIFNALIAINAVTSQRIDQDYFFHKSQNTSLQAVVRNMLVSTFHWTGTSPKDIEGALAVAKQALKVHGPKYSPADVKLLKDSISILSLAESSDVWVQTSAKHEMGYYIDTSLPTESQQYYLLSGTKADLLGGTAVIEAQRAVREALTDTKTEDTTYNEYLVHRLTSSGIKNRAREAKEAEQAFKAKNRSTPNGKKTLPTPPNSGQNDGSRKSVTTKANSKLSAKRNQQVNEAVDQVHLAGEDLQIFSKTPSPTKPGLPISPVKTSPKSANEDVSVQEQARRLQQAHSLSHIKITSTASAKLNYLLTAIQEHSKDEKIIVFSDFVDHTYHLAEALDIIGVPYLLYTSSLKPVLKNRYILTFNTSETFRVMIMELQLAAHGLNLSTASRVYFIQQCWSGATESQAIKRAHRIGQVRPVTVEILVLKGSIEEVMQRRRMILTGRELGDTRSVTDDTMLRNAIRSPAFLHDPPHRVALDPTFPLFHVNFDGGEGEEGLAPMEVDDTPPPSRAESPVPSVTRKTNANKTKRPSKKIKFEEVSDAESSSASPVPPRRVKSLRFDV